MWNIAAESLKCWLPCITCVDFTKIIDDFFRLTSKNVQTICKMVSSVMSLLSVKSDMIIALRLNTATEATPPLDNFTSTLSCFNLDTSSDFSSFFMKCFPARSSSEEKGKLLSFVLEYLLTRSIISSWTVRLIL